MSDTLLSIPSTGIADSTSAQNYTDYTYSYTATLAQTYITFEFRQDPAYWGLDDVSVTDSGGTNLVGNGGFETGNLTDWTLIGTRVSKPQAKSTLVTPAQPQIIPIQEATFSVTALWAASTEFISHLIPLSDRTIRPTSGWRTTAAVRHWR